MKKKIVAMCATVALAALAIGGTLAYFTDIDNKDNVFTLGNVDIAIDENFDPAGTLMPDEENKTTKEVFVKNEGTEPAYVRVHYAIPSALVDQEINSYNDILHVNMSRDSIAAGQWSWLPKYAGPDAKGWTDNGKAYNNTYNTTIGGVEHTVWVVTYTSKVEAGEKTVTPAISSVYMDKNVEAAGSDDGSVTYTKPNYTDGSRDKNKADGVMSYTATKDANDGLTMTIKVIAEGTQVDSFDDAYEALNAAFGVPGTYNPWA